MALFRLEHKQLLEFNYPGRADYRDILSSLGTFLERKILPNSPKFDAKTEEAQPARKALFENGICQIPYPREYGGLGLPFGIYCLAVELVGAADAGIAMSVAIHNTAAEGVFRFASDSMKRKYLPDIISGRKLASFSLTEPTSGSDAKAINTKARKKGGEYVLNGSKMFITNAGEADVYFVFATTDKGPSTFLVEKTSEGLQFGGDLPKLGMRSSRTSEVRFVDCRIPEDSLVGKEGQGFEYAKALLNGSRIVMGSLCVGVAQIAFDKAVAYSRQRRAFGSAISEFQLIREKIADMKTGISAGRLLCVYAARVREAGGDYSSEASQAKVFSTEMAARVCDSAIQIFGGYGYTTDDVHRHWRDARLLTIGEGTSEVLRLLIAAGELARTP
ncbi:MAG: acyl-CoA dehydrogenase family protein [Nitrososphaerales archaeon]|nr:acyl-CoA dehydrogenase family protein [Nitrososphaerales archaeon]